MDATPSGEIAVTAGTLPPAPTTPPLLMAGPPAVAVRWNWTGATPATAAVITTGPESLPSVTATLADPESFVFTVPAFSVADPDVTANTTGIPAALMPPPKLTFTPTASRPAAFTSPLSPP